MNGKLAEPMNTGENENDATKSIGFAAYPLISEWRGKDYSQTAQIISYSVWKSVNSDVWFVLFENEYFSIQILFVK